MRSNGKMLAARNDDDDTKIIKKCLEVIFFEYKSCHP